MIHLWAGCSMAGFLQIHAGPPQVSSSSILSSSSESIPSSAARSDEGWQTQIYSESELSAVDADFALLGWLEAALDVWTRSQRLCACSAS